ncbi:MAG TPA: hypothetical protein VM012_00645 [Flavitalea sp.]|nr:hypothetical protein [Flavitalea sp.]
MSYDMRLVAAILPVDKAVSKTDFIYKVKLTVLGNNRRLLDALYLLPFTRISKDLNGNLVLY